MLTVRGEHPNSDNTDSDRFTMKCNVKDGSDLMEFNWKFYKKDNQDNVPDNVEDETTSTPVKSGSGYHSGWRAVFPVITLAVILATIVYLVQRRQQLFNRSIAQVFYQQDNANFVSQPVFPTPPPPAPSVQNQHHYNNNDPWKPSFTC